MWSPTALCVAHGTHLLHSCRPHRPPPPPPHPPLPPGRAANSAKQSSLFFRPTCVGAASQRMLTIHNASRVAVAWKWQVRGRGLGRGRGHGVCMCERGCACVCMVVCPWACSIRGCARVARVGRADRPQVKKSRRSSARHCPDWAGTADSSCSIHTAPSRSVPLPAAAPEVGGRGGCGAGHGPAARQRGGASGVELCAHQGEDVRGKVGAGVGGVDVGAGAGVGLARAWVWVWVRVWGAPS